MKAVELNPGTYATLNRKAEKVTQACVGNWFKTPAYQNRDFLVLLKPYKDGEDQNIC